jgi:RNA polymerase sigma-70 factor (ECF subfamily)
MTQEVSDLELIKKFKNGSQVSFEQLVSRHESKMYSIALRYTKNQEDAEEVIQDVCVTLYHKVQNFEGKSAFSSWLYRIVVNSSLMKLRKNRQEKATLVDDLTPISKQDYLQQNCEDFNRADVRSIQHETRVVLEAAINRLAEEYRSVFIMRDVDGLSNEEVSSLLSISVPAVKSRLHRARLMLRKKLNAYWNDYNGNEQMDNFQMAVNH